MEIEREILGGSGQPAVRVLYGPIATYCQLYNTAAVSVKRLIGGEMGLGVDGGGVWGWTVGQ